MTKLKPLLCSLIAGFFILASLLGCWCCNKQEDNGQEDLLPQWLPATEEVNGSVATVAGMQVLKLWGTPYEMGYANGYLAAPQIYDLYSEAIEVHNLTNEKLKNEYHPLLSRLILPARYSEELRGILAGMEARAGGSIYFPALKRAMIFEDIYAGHVVTELYDLNCSSFTAWGPMTEDGSLIGGTNRDWGNNEGLFRRENQWIIVRFPNTGSGRKSWISINNPGTLGCSKGINEEGLFVHMHNANGRTRSVDKGFLMDDLFFSEVLERVDLNSSGEQIRSLLVPFTTNDGTNMMVGMPYNGTNIPSFKLEIDGDETFENGVSLWEPVPPRPYLVSTNHFRKRLDPLQSTWRFDYDTNRLENIYNSGGQTHVTVDLVFDMLQNTATGDAVHSIVYEPRRMMMHIAYLLKGQSISDVNVVTMDLRSLFVK
jgi:hypothetical protein